MMHRGFVCLLIAAFSVLFASCQYPICRAPSGETTSVISNPFQEYVSEQCESMGLAAPSVEADEETCFYEYEKDGKASTVVFINANGEYKTFLPYETRVEDGFGYSLIETDTEKLVSFYLLPPTLYDPNIGEIYLGFSDGTGYSFFMDLEYLRTLHFFGRTFEIERLDESLRTNSMVIELINMDKEVMISYEIKNEERKD